MSPKRIDMLGRGLLGSAQAKDFAARLAAAKASGGDEFVGAWCAETMTGLVVEVHAGKATRWHASGPMTRAEAAHWLGVLEAALTPAASPTPN